jgi:hypothetical protein
MQLLRPFLYSLPIGAFLPGTPGRVLPGVLAGRRPLGNEPFETLYPRLQSWKWPSKSN